jgi:hypothetical protein
MISGAWASFQGLDSGKFSWRLRKLNSRDGLVTGKALWNLPKQSPNGDCRKEYSL